MTPKPEPKPKRGRVRASVEHNLLLTATLCLLAFGVVMVFSASSTTSLLGEAGDGAYFLKRTVLFGVVGLVVLRLLSARGLTVVRAATPVLLAASVVLLVAVLVPGIGVEANGSRRWIAAGSFTIQPSELAKLALVLHGANLLATRPAMTRRIGTLMPFLLPVALVCLLVVVEPDLGTAMVACLTAAALLVVAGVRFRDLALLGAALGIVVLAAVALEPYRMARLSGFLDPGADPTGAGFQTIQAQIALGSGGLLGVGLGESLQKAFYLPEAHTDMIAAVIGEELGLIGICLLVALYGMLAYAGLRIAQRTRDRYAKLLAAGITALICVQAVINLFAVLGLAPLTGVPLPFVSYGNSSMLVMLAGVGLLLNVASGGRAPVAQPSGRRRTPSAARRGRTVKRPASRSAPATARAAGARAGVRAARGRSGARLRVVDGGGAPARAARPRRSSRGDERRNRGRGNGGARGPGARRGRRAAG